MEGKRLLSSITLQNVLSFGSEEATVDFEPLNVLIGPNTSGKSNLIDVLGFLRTLPHELSQVFREGKGLSDWLWKGAERGNFFLIRSKWDRGPQQSIFHGFALGRKDDKLQVFREWISKQDQLESRLLFLAGESDLIIDRDIVIFRGFENLEVPRIYRNDESILAQRRDIDRFPEAAYIGDCFSRIRLYRQWYFGRKSRVRELQLSDLSNGFLNEDALNLNVVLKRLMQTEEVKNSINESLKILSPDMECVEIRDIGDFTELNVRESGGRLISAHRLSDGTLRFLALLAILCDPNSSEVVCIEEPEIGLHPDIIPTIAKLLIEASQRTQLIVTTHSADLVSALWEFPESVVVCERGFEGETQLKRLDPKRLEKWLERYSLGELWLNGEIGGTRW